MVWFNIDIDCFGDDVIKHSTRTEGSSGRGLEVGIKDVEEINQEKLTKRF
jgi:hypothetical protein